MAGAAKFDPRNPNYFLDRTRQIESGGRNWVTSPTGAAGPYQFINSTAARYGLSSQDRYDPVKSRSAALQLAMDNANYLKRALGRDPTNGEVYLAHQQGPAAAAALLKNPQMPAGQALIIGGAYKNPETANRALRVNGGSPTMPSMTFANQWLNKFDGGGAQPANYATTTPSSSPTATTPRETQVAALPPTTQNVGATPAATPGPTTTPAPEGGDPGFSFEPMQDDLEPPQYEPEEQATQRTARSGGGNPNFGMTVSGGPAQEIDMQSRNVNDPSFTALAQQSAQRMGEIGNSQLGDLFANAIPGAEGIGNAGKTTLPQLLKSYSVAGQAGGIGAAGKPDLAAAVSNAGSNRRIG
jgi:hypothetical protein